MISDRQFIRQWENITEYRHIIMHKSAVMIIPTGKNPPLTGIIDYFGVIKKPSLYLSDLSKKVEPINMDNKIKEIQKITTDTFIKLSEAML